MKNTPVEIPLSILEREGVHHEIIPGYDARLRSKHVYVANIIFFRSYDGSLQAAPGDLLCVGKLDLKGTGNTVWVDAGFSVWSLTNQPFSLFIDEKRDDYEHRLVSVTMSELGPEIAELLEEKR